MKRVISFNGGEKINNLIIIKKLPVPNNIWLCRCFCGKEKGIRATELLNASIKSCGCLRGEKHDYVGTALYKSWSAMKDRCDNPNNKSYSYYGGRGIKYSPEWKKFIAFKEWALISGYKKGLTIERINYNGNYCPNNCTWATRAEQSENTSAVVKYLGETAASAARRLGGSSDTVAARIRLGWTKERAFTTPIRIDSRNRTKHL